MTVVLGSDVVCPCTNTPNSETPVDEWHELAEEMIKFMADGLTGRDPNQRRAVVDQSVVESWQRRARIICR